MTNIATRSLAGFLMAGCISVPAMAADLASKAGEDDVTAEARGDDAAADEQSEAEILVTGKAVRSSPLAAGVAEYGNAVQIVDSAAIEASGATNFAEAVQFLVKGANIGYSPDEGEYTIRLDGGGDRDTLVVLDGVPLYDRGPALEEIWGATTIDPHMIDRVEVFRGGNSLFFGSNGGIGVVSVVTKKPDGGKRFEFGANVGSFGTRDIWGNVSFPLDTDGRHSIMIYGTAQHTDNPRIFNPADFVDNVAAGGGIQEFPTDRDNVGVKYLWKPDDRTEFRVNGQFTQIQFHDPFPDTNTYSPNTVKYPIVDASFVRTWSERLTTEVSAYWSNPQLSNTETFPEVCMIKTGCVSPSTGQAIAWGKYTGRNIAFPNQGFGPDSKKSGFRELGGNARATFTIPNAIEVVGGVQIVSYKDDSDPVFPVGNEATTITGLYADFRPVLPFSPATRISLAVRTDFADSFGSKTIWKFGLRQPIGDFYLRANGGTSYSTPKNNELHAESATTVGNPDLKTEETETYNVGIGYGAGFGAVRVNAEIGGFHTDITNRIQSTSGLTPNTFFNNDRITQIRGLTAELDVAIGSQFAANVSYTKQQARLDGSKLQINETPEYIVQGNFAWHSSDRHFHVNLMPRYQGPEYATGGVNAALRTNFGNYFVANASIAYWAGAERQHRFQLRIANLFDADYAERWAYGNTRFSEAFVTGQIKLNGPGYFYGYPFEGKPRSYYLSYMTQF
ncbi:TonB-dependent siderophore receptor [Sphingosinicella sp. BN140058]|uniref:TonB-dependent receptor plug domain-containing protein n=1 Tax=Sphingosinicella sp. BN140058 TaxID=1892855 RepID=UPI001FB1191B|nr:TonB-dependent receptor plug domain-containing protein [Sphingosinicella sp. BN140058]